MRTGARSEAKWPSPPPECPGRKREALPVRYKRHNSRLSTELKRGLKNKPTFKPLTVCVISVQPFLRFLSFTLLGARQSVVVVLSCQSVNITPSVHSRATTFKGSNRMKRCLGYILLTTMACSMTYYFMNPQIVEYSFRLNSISEPSTTQYFPWWREVLCEGTSQQGSRMLELPWLQRDVEPPESDDNIFLVETACKTTPSFRVWCAIESWSRQNPSSQVWYVMTSLTVNDTDGLVSRLQEQYSNLRIVGADVEKIFEGTGLSGLFSSRKWVMNAKWPAVKLSDLIRVALLWRWGGFYTDTDTVCIKDVSPLRNVISFSNNKRNLISNGAFQFHHHHKFLELLMEVQTKSFKVRFTFRCNE
ncbi:uncharacterized protein LOC134784229 [Penaeus indicus]|uniref:uncharacterized protein LOC134784229 n=1 Tax=Penaeus indicus TaxID=29960 RepID=UPI00300D5A56